MTSAAHLRACQLCTHHTVVEGALYCTEATVAGPLRRVPCEVARYRDTGGCGRDASRMHWPRLEAPARRTPTELWEHAA